MNFYQLISSVLAALVLSSQAHAGSYGFAFSGTGVRGSITLTFSAASDSRYTDALEITGVSGTFSDSNAGLDISGAQIVSLVPITNDLPEPANLLAPHDFSHFAVASGLEHGALSFDNLLYLGGSPQTATSYPFHGGVFDIYGLLFQLDDGRFVNLWSNGDLGSGVIDYGVAVVTHDSTLDYVAGVSPVPEPATSVMLFGGLLGMLSYRRRLGRQGVKAMATVSGFALVTLSACGGDSTSAGSHPGPTTGVITVSQNHVLRDGSVWVPHAVQLVAFVAPPGSQTGPFVGAFAHYSEAEFSAIKAWGADSVRLQLSQPAADPSNTSPLIGAKYDPDFLQLYVRAVKAARAIGLNVIVSIQDEEQSGEPSPAALPNAATNRVWKNLAPMLNGDEGIVYEMMNEPQLANNAANWQKWADAMNAVVQTIRATGATNTLLADGLNYAESLNGVIALSDPLNKVFYSTHPYFHSANDQTRAVWTSKFGATAAVLPVIVGEWTPATPANPATTYYCDSETPAAALQFLQYLQSLNVGLVAVTYDFGLPRYGGIVSDYDGTPTTYANNLRCGDPGFGPGTLIQQWYRTGVVPERLQ